jgi:Tfp pilus assembly protein PilO
MIGNLSRRERVLVMLAVVVGVLMFGWLGIVQPLHDRFAAAAELLPARQQVLMQRQELVARKAAIQRDLEATNARLEALSGRFFPATTPAVVASELQKLVKEMAAQASTEVRSERILTPVDRSGDLLEIPIEIAVSADIRQLTDLLGRLERAPKLLAVQDLKIRVINVSQPKELLVTLTLSGFILPVKAKT